MNEEARNTLFPEIACIQRNASGGAQSTYMSATSLRELIDHSLRTAMSRKKTRIFPNLCDKEDLDAWNDMQGNPLIYVIKEKDIAVPVKHIMTPVEAIRVDYTEIDSVLFNISFLLHIAKYSLNIDEYMRHFFDTALKDYLTELIIEGTDTVVNFMQRVKTSYSFLDPKKVTEEMLMDLLKEDRGSKNKTKEIKKKNKVYNKKEKPEEGELI